MYFRSVTSPKRSPLGSSARSTLAWFSVLAGLLLTALAVYDLADGERNPSLWLAIVCWPIVTISGALQVVRIRRDG
jgi:hypothetical protein